MHRFGLQVADARQFRNKWMTRLSKLERTDADAIEWGRFGHKRQYNEFAESGRSMAPSTLS